MSIEYDNYLSEHRTNVGRGIDWFKRNLPDAFDCDSFYSPIGWDHDFSKNSVEEYDAYDQYFYGKRRTRTVEEDFNKAWLHHIHHNPHHWQHWVLVNDSPEEGTVALRIPHRYVIEMICDWWAFSWSKGNLYEIFDWYDKHKTYMVLHKDTRELVEEILGRIKDKLDETNEESVKKSE